MAELAKFTESIFSNLAKSKVNSVFGGVIHFIDEGRNAWHSTWTITYSEGCIHSSMKSAKSYAENQRTQGTIFYIQGIPSLIFESNVGYIVVTEINASTPLHAYSEKATSKNIRYLKENIGSGSSISNVVQAFSKNSSIIITATENQDITFESIEDDFYKTKSSFSKSAESLLGWKEENTGLRKKAVSDLLQRLNSPIEKT